MRLKWTTSWERERIYTLMAQVIIVFDILLLSCRIMLVIQAIPVSEEVPGIQQERNILLILWWVFLSLLKPDFFFYQSGIKVLLYECSDVFTIHRYFFFNRHYLCHFLWCRIVLVRLYISLLVSCYSLSLRLSVLITTFNFFGINSCFQPQLGCLQAGRRSETVKEDATMSTTTAEQLRGHDPLFRYKVGVSFFCLTCSVWIWNQVKVIC